MLSLRLKVLRSATRVSDGCARHGRHCCMGGRVSVFAAHLFSVAARFFARLRPAPLELAHCRCCRRCSSLSRSRKIKRTPSVASHLTTLLLYSLQNRSRSFTYCCAAHGTPERPLIPQLALPYPTCGCHHGCRRTRQRRAKSQVLEVPRSSELGRPRLGRRGRALRRWVPTQTWRQRVGILPLQAPALRVSSREQAPKCSRGSLPCKPSSERSSTSSWRSSPSWKRSYRRRSALTQR